MQGQIRPTWLLAGALPHVPTPLILHHFHPMFLPSTSPVAPTERQHTHGTKHNAEAPTPGALPNAMPAPWTVVQALTCAKWLLWFTMHERGCFRPCIRFPGVGQYQQAQGDALSGKPFSHPSSHTSDSALQFRGPTT